MRLKYSGKNVLVLGGSCEIGLETTRLLSGCGLNVFPTFYSNGGKFKGVPGNVKPFFFDLGSEAALPGIAAGNYDYLVDLAHTDYEALIASAPDEAVEKYFKINVINRTKFLKAVTRKMLLRRFGRLVYVSSAAVRLPSEGQGYYAASKNAMESVYRQAGLELAGKGITSVCLRYCCLDGGRGKKFLERAALPPLTPAEAAGHIAFFLSDDSRGINAVSVTIDQGLPPHKRKLAPGRARKI